MSNRRSARLRTILCVIPLALVAVVVGPASPASAAVPCGRATAPPAGVKVPLPYVGTAYGPVTYGVKISGNSATPGFLSEITNQFSPTGSAAPINSSTASVEGLVNSTDPYYVYFCGYVSVNTPYGPVIFGMEYNLNTSLIIYGRWGNYNLASKLFYPDQQNTWYPAAM